MWEGRLIFSFEELRISSPLSSRSSLSPPLIDLSPPGYAGCLLCDHAADAFLSLSLGTVPASGMIAADKKYAYCTYIIMQSIYNGLLPTASSPLPGNHCHMSCRLSGWCDRAQKWIEVSGACKYTPQEEIDFGWAEVAFPAVFKYILLSFVFWTTPSFSLSLSLPIPLSLSLSHIW